MSAKATSHLIWEQRHQPRTDSRDGDHRSAAQRDKARVMHSAAFRRLQAKTQIHGIGLSLASPKTSKACLNWGKHVTFGVTTAMSSAYALSVASGGRSLVT